MLKLGIFGGSFNPTHNAHVAMAASAVNQLQLDKVILLPNNVSPFKRQFTQVHGTHKLRMLWSLVAVCPSRFCISNFEMLQSISYTYATLEFFHYLFPSAELFFLLGSDSFQSFHRWKYWESILNKARLLLFSRSQYGIKSVYNNFSESHRKRIIYADAVLPHVSSSQVRMAVHQRQNITHLCPLSVCEYIRRENLYKIES